jgi:hypothetical protein
LSVAFVKSKAEPASVGAVGESITDVPPSMSNRATLGMLTETLCAPSSVSAKILIVENKKITVSEKKVKFFILWFLKSL